MYTEEEQRLVDLGVRAADAAYKKGAKDALQGMKEVIENYAHAPYVRQNLRMGLQKLTRKLCG